MDRDNQDSQQAPQDAAPAAIQERIHAIQRLYREWTLLVPQLEAAQAQWQRGAEIMAELERFYFGGEFSQYHGALEKGLKLELHTQGEYSVMSEDALWNASAELQTLAWQRLRSSAVAVPDREGEDLRPDGAVPVRCNTGYSAIKTTRRRRR